MRQEKKYTIFYSCDYTPKLLTYISCGFDAFQRDADALLDSGKWRIYHAEGHLLFPGSDAIETLAFFARTSMS